MEQTEHHMEEQKSGQGQSAPPVPAVPATGTNPGVTQTVAPGPSIGEQIHQFESRLPSLNEALSTLASFIPGFAGYKSTEDRRIADKQLRAVIGERLTNVRGRVDGVVDTLSRSGNLDGVALIDQSSRRLGRLIDRMRFADYGYAAVFDRVQMGDAELAKIYAYDTALMGELGKFESAVGEIEQGAADPTALRSALSKLDALTAEFDRRFEGRKHLFDGLPTP
ncbi:MAG TPA: hypothetical protein VEV38_01380 [Candidatus Eremiobacteraceae bacterium]|nr:hypothetical protein [Candidatus Eremiobacteraceae bacterium]